MNRGFLNHCEFESWNDIGSETQICTPSKPTVASPRCVTNQVIDRDTLEPFDVVSSPPNALASRPLTRELWSFRANSSSIGKRNLREHCQPAFLAGGMGAPIGNLDLLAAQSRYMAWPIRLHSRSLSRVHRDLGRSPIGPSTFLAKQNRPVCPARSRAKSQCRTR
jgi:hypothetical protein